MAVVEEALATLLVVVLEEEVATLLLQVRTYARMAPSALNGRSGGAGLIEVKDVAHAYEIYITCD